MATPTSVMILTVISSQDLDFNVNLDITYVLPDTIAAATSYMYVKNNSITKVVVLFFFSPLA